MDRDSRRDGRTVWRRSRVARRAAQVAGALALVALTTGTFAACTSEPATSGETTSAEPASEPATSPTASPASAPEGTGTISGVVTTTARSPRPLRVTVDQGVCGSALPDESIVVDGSGRLKNAVVVLTGVEGGALPEAAIANEKCAFVPRVQVTRPNQNVRATSHDAVLHTTNAFDESGAQLFNVGLPVQGMSIARPVGGKGLVRIACNTHPWMLGWIVVTDEMAAVTGADGRFTLSGVPPGTYELRIWHESLAGAPQEVTVEAGGTTTADFTLEP